MSHGILTSVQRDIVKRFVIGCTVHDLGAGDLELAHMLVELGAKLVIAVDKEQMPLTLEPKIMRLQQTFESYMVASGRSQLETSFVSWPREYGDESLLALVARSKICIYLGKNTDITACGGQDLFRHFLTRRCLAYVPDRMNVLIVLGEPLVGTETRAPHGEEIAALDRTTVYSFGEAEAKSL